MPRPPEHLISRERAPNFGFLEFLLVSHQRHDRWNCAARATACSNAKRRRQCHLLICLQTLPFARPLVGSPQFVVKSHGSNAATGIEDNAPSTFLPSTPPIQSANIYAILILHTIPLPPCLHSRSHRLRSFTRREQINLWSNPNLRIEPRLEYFLQTPQISQALFTLRLSHHLLHSVCWLRLLHLRLPRGG